MRSNNYTLDGVSGKRRSVRVRGGVRVWGSLVWYRIAEIWCFGTCTVIDLNHVATSYYAVEMREVVRGIDCGSNGEKLAWSVWKRI